MEVKIRLRDRADVYAHLTRLKARETVHLRHIDRYYNAPPVLCDFSKTDEAIRIRSSHEFLPGESEPIKIVHDLTYKGAKLDLTIKTRVEHISYIDNPETMEQILLALGFSRIATLTKDRIVFKLTFGGFPMEILLDQVMGIEGDFLEAEIMASPGQNQDQIKRVLLNFLTELGYVATDSITDSYLEIFLAKTEK